MAKKKSTENLTEKSNNLINLDNFKLQFITNSDEKLNLKTIKSVLDGGCKWIQLRIKGKNHKPTSAELKNIANIAKKVKFLCEIYQATFIVNDFAEIASEIDADGVHLGKKDMSISEARKILGYNKIIGMTANSFEDILSLKNLKIDYIGLGPFRFTKTKENLSPILGLEGYKNIFSALKSSDINSPNSPKNLNVPIVAVGGITKDDVSNIMKTGISGIAVSGAILNSKNIEEEVQLFLRNIKLELKNIKL